MNLLVDVGGEVPLAVPSFLSDPGLGRHSPGVGKRTGDVLAGAGGWTGSLAGNRHVLKSLREVGAGRGVRGGGAGRSDGGGGVGRGRGAGIWVRRGSDNAGRRGQLIDWNGVVNKFVVIKVGGLCRSSSGINLDKGRRGRASAVSPASLEVANLCVERLLLSLPLTLAGGNRQNCSVDGEGEATLRLPILIWTQHLCRFSTF